MIEAALGAVLGTGLWLLVDGNRRSSLVTRLAPHLRDVSSSAVRQSRARGVFEILAALAPNPIRAVIDLWKSRASARRRMIESEMPAIVDRASVCLSAGVAIPAMFERIGVDSIGLLGGEARTIAREVSAGTALVDACSASERRVRHESWSRFIEHLLSARRHGTPIADIVRALAADERSAAGRRLVEAASSREIYMLLPLVFVILPMTVVVAVFPGLVALGSLPV